MLPLVSRHPEGRGATLCCLLCLINVVAELHYCCPTLFTYMICGNGGDCVENRGKSGPVSKGIAQRWNSFEGFWFTTIWWVVRIGGVHKVVVDIWCYSQDPSHPSWLKGLCYIALPQDLETPICYLEGLLVFSLVHLPSAASVWVYYFSI